MTTYAQIFCTVDDIVADAQSAGADETRMLSAIREASDFLQKEIGWFIPVTQTLRFRAPENAETLFVPPLLAVTSISNDGETLTSDDYLLHPDGGFWGNGPYSRIVADPDSALLFTWSDIVNGVEISGRWGKYERSGATGATVQNATAQTVGAGTLLVSDGSKVSPGMVLLIGTEQELVTGWGDPTASVTTASASVAVTDQTITVTDASLVNVGEVIRIDFEQMKVLDRRTSTYKLSVIRGWNGTAVVSHTSTTAVDVYRTVNVERGVNGTTAAEHLNGVAISRYFPPDEIVGLTKQIATLLVNKAKGGYQQRAGNAELGAVYYNEAFPRFEIARVKRSFMFSRVP